VRAQNRPVAAIVYIGRAAKTGAPRPGYLDIVAAAARVWDLPPDYVRALTQWERSASANNNEGAV